ncbi:MAG: putative signal transducing protein [Bacteroidota bacterium]
MADLVCIGTFPSRTEAEIARGFLESAGIRSAIAADDCGEEYPNMLLGSGGARLLVAKEDAREASEALRHLVVPPMEGDEEPPAAD